MFFNGMSNRHEEVHSTATAIHNSVGGGSVGTSHNNTRGFMSDLLEAFAGCLGFQTEASRTVAQSIRTRLSQIDGPLNILAHSQGGIDLKNALKLLSPEDKKRLNIRTFGSPVLFNDRDVASLKHFVSNNDPVTWLNLVGLTKRLFGGESHVQYLPSQSGRLEHSIDCKTYQTALKETLDDFKNLYRS